MEEQLILYETAKLAKEKGFIYKTLDDLYQKKLYLNLSEIPQSLYDSLSNDEFINDKIYRFTIQTGYIPNEYLDMIILCPTQSLLQRWLREVHKLHIYIDTTASFDKTEKSKYRSAIKVPFQPFRWTTAHYYLGDTYEECLEKGLQEALKLIK